MGDYEQFLASKRIIVQPSGFTVQPDDIHTMLFDFQRDLTRWAIRKGRCAVFADTGLGKTYVAAEVARLITEHEDGKALIVAPLSVARQTVKLSKDIGVDVHYTRDGSNLAQINITNYELVDRFNPADFVAVGLDESSVLKGISSKRRALMTEMFREVPYRHCYTATPAPNDIAEIANHAEFLGIMTRTEMLAAFFVHDADGWRLKGHAKENFYRWLASWGMSVRKPSDLGYDDDGFILPPLEIESVWVEVNHAELAPEGEMFFIELKGVSHRAQVRRKTMADRVAKAAELVNRDQFHQWICWCGLNDESKMLAEAIPDSVEVTGSMSNDAKVAAIEAFQDGVYRVLVSKPRIAGFGMNFQNATRQVFVGLSDSWEAYYQCVRRSWRFGQTQPVHAYIVLSEAEQGIYQNVMEKEEQAKIMSEELIGNVAEYEREEIQNVELGKFEYETGEATGENWRLLLGDSVERLREFADQSVDLSAFSPPFEALYTYSPTERDLGNCTDSGEFLTHFGFIVDELLRVTKPGRICAVHVADVPAMLVRDGYIGLKDFSGDVIRLFVAHGWIFDSRIPLDKNQQAQSIRTHAKALTMTQLEKDRSWLRPALPDYILKFRKPGENAVLVASENEVSRDTWIEWANPTWPGENGDRCGDAGAMSTWYGISESDTLQGWQKARGDKDERHICPLQLGTIERCVKLWSNPGELVLDPFAGIASTGVVAIRAGRLFIGIELKPEYFQFACNYLQRVEAESKQDDLFTFAGIEV